MWATSVSVRSSLVQRTSTRNKLSLSMGTAAKDSARDESAPW
jgi:hypothetical protein